jgi:hypothetical protein
LTIGSISPVSAGGQAGIAAIGVGEAGQQMAHEPFARLDSWELINHDLQDKDEGPATPTAPEELGKHDEVAASTQDEPFPPLQVQVGDNDVFAAYTGPSLR